MKNKSQSKCPGAVISGRALPMAVTAALLLMAIQTDVQAGYSITRSTIASGGGKSTQGNYSLSGSMGQPDAGSPMEGGVYSIVGGFWAQLVVQSPGAPTLRIYVTTNRSTVIAWPASATGWILESCVSLDTPSWSAVNGAISAVGNENQFITHSASGHRFFRLTHL